MIKLSSVFIEIKNVRMVKDFCERSVEMVERGNKKLAGQKKSKRRDNEDAKERKDLSSYHDEEDIPRRSFAKACGSLARLIRGIYNA